MLSFSPTTKNPKNKIKKNEKNLTKCTSIHSKGIVIVNKSNKEINVNFGGQTMLNILRLIVPPSPPFNFNHCVSNSLSKNVNKNSSKAKYVKYFRIH